jgi:hypothetical protein
VTTFLIVAGSILGYLAIGLAAARTQAVRIYRWRWDSNVRSYSESIAKEYAPFEAKFTLLGIAAAWPLALVVLAGLGVVGLAFAPVTERKARAEQLRADAEIWRETARTETDPQKKDMAKELARVLREQAEEVDP